MLGKLDHVGYLTADLDAAVAQFTSTLGLALVRRFERPQFALAGAYLGEGEGTVELFTFTDPALMRAQLGDRAPGAAPQLHHVAFAVHNIDAVARSLRHAGVRFSGPDLRGELDAPVDLGGVRHLWTIPATSGGQSLQLLER